MARAGDDRNRGDVARAKPEPDLFFACQQRLGLALDSLGLGSIGRRRQPEPKKRAAGARMLSVDNYGPKKK